MANLPVLYRGVARGLGTGRGAGKTINIKRLLFPRTLRKVRATILSLKSKGKYTGRAFKEPFKIPFVELHMRSFGKRQTAREIGSRLKKGGVEGFPANIFPPKIRRRIETKIYSKTRVPSNKTLGAAYKAGEKTKMWGPTVGLYGGLVGAGIYRQRKLKKKQQKVRRMRRSK